MNFKDAAAQNALEELEKLYKDRYPGLAEAMRRGADALKIKAKLELLLEIYKGAGK